MPDIPTLQLYEQRYVDPWLFFEARTSRQAIIVGNIGIQDFERKAGSGNTAGET